MRCPLTTMVPAPEFGGMSVVVDPGGIAGSQRRTGQQHGPVGEEVRIFISENSII